MKSVVNVVQLIIVVAIIFPIFYIWDTDNVDRICQSIGNGMTKQDFIKLAVDSPIKLLGPIAVDDEVVGGKWQASIVTYWPFTDYMCLVKGIGNTVSTARIVD